MGLHELSLIDRLSALTPEAPDKGSFGVVLVDVLRAIAIDDINVSVVADCCLRRAFGFVLRVTYFEKDVACEIRFYHAASSIGNVEKRRLVLHI